MSRKKHSPTEVNTPMFQCWDMPVPVDLYYVILEFCDRRPAFYPILGATSHEDAMWIALTRHAKKSKIDPEWIRCEGRCCNQGCVCGGRNEGLRVWFGPLKRRWDALTEKLLLQSRGKSTE